MFPIRTQGRAKSGFPCYFLKKKDSKTKEIEFTFDPANTLLPHILFYSDMQPFHLAFPVTDLHKTHEFYHVLLGCPIGRTSDRWIDFNFWGNQITAHLVDKENAKETTNQVDGKKVPVKHFGAILKMEEWEALAEKLKGVGMEFIIEPYTRFKGEAGEQATMFFLDPSGNAIEFKSFRNFDQIFAK